MATDEQPPEEAQPNGAGTDADAPATAADDSSDDTLLRMLAAISEQVGEIRDQLERLLSVQVDRLRLGVRKGLFWLLSSLLFGAVCVVATAAAVLYLLEGVSGLFTALFGGNVWAGDLAAGGSVLITVGLVVLIFGRRFGKSELARLKNKYESDPAKGEAP